MRYAVFKYSRYYPSGGFNDFSARFWLKSSALSFVRQECYANEGFFIDIIDLLTGKSIYNYENKYVPEDMGYWSYQPRYETGMIRTFGEAQ